MFIKSRRIADIVLIMGAIYFFVFGLESTSNHVLSHCTISLLILLLGIGLKIYLLLSLYKKSHNTKDLNK